jgi:hypothetical protein
MMLLDSILKQPFLSRRMISRAMGRFLWVSCLACLPVSVHCQSEMNELPSTKGMIHIDQLSDYHENQQLKVDAQVNIVLSQRMKDALQHEIPLTFETELQLNERFNFLGLNLTRNRVHILYKTKLYYFTYNGLYFITNLRNGQTQSFESLKEALNTLGTIDNFMLTDLAELHPNTRYTLKLRLKFDPWDLPSPLLIETLVSQDWHLSSGWHDVTIQSPSSWY